jgi:hypothetical protein
VEKNLMQSKRKKRLTNKLRKDNIFEGFNYAPIPVYSKKRTNHTNFNSIVYKTQATFQQTFKNTKNKDFTFAEAI